jgi:peroxiredoxin/tetratricopeptide (TPR) repeat protein
MIRLRAIGSARWQHGVFAVANRLVLVCILVGVLAAATSARCDDGLLPGHSHIGEAFDRGPRQSAYLMGGTGKIHFPVTSKNPLVQKFIEQGVGQLHGFWYGEAERSFREAAKLDPNCGMAYWGMSQAALLNKNRVAQFAAEASKHKAGLSERERMYIDALSNESGYRELIAKYPNDLEAKAFEVWRQWHIAESGGGQAGDLEEAMKLAEEILSVDPMHPIHHAVIHMADGTSTYRRGLDSASKCGEAAPSIGHMWHMPTHIYSALKQYPAAAWQLEACLRTDNARTMHDHVAPYQVELYAHNDEWLVRMLLHLGRVRDARRLAMEMIDLPRHPLFNVLEPPPEVETKKPKGAKPKDEGGGTEESAQDRTRESHGTSAYFGRERLLQVLRRYECWDELIDVCTNGYIELTRLPAEQGKVHANLGVAYYSRGNVSDGDHELAELRTIRDDQLAKRNAALDEAAGRPEIERTSAFAAVDKRFGRMLASLESQIAQLEAYRRIVTGFFLSRDRLFVYLGLLFVAEIVAIWILRRRMMRVVLSGFAALLLTGSLIYCHLALLNLASDSINVDFAFVTRKQLETGDLQQAEWSARQFARERPRQVRPQANLVEVLYKTGKTKEAREEFENLRELAGVADLDAPPLARLAPIAREFGFPTDWRQPERILQSLGKRRPLSSLGPFEWHPWSAPNWKLTDAEGRTHELAEFRGKPVVLLFFLGRGCLHCQQQLAAFAKKAGDFSEAGLTVVAVSTDDQAGIRKSLVDLTANSKVDGSAAGTSAVEGGFPFLMLADPKLGVFRSYGAFDDFEQISLHGSFLVDGNGLVRWTDVSFEPFLDAGFLLNEAKRLLARPVAPIEPDARVFGERAALSSRCEPGDI